MQTIYRAEYLELPFGGTITDVAFNCGQLQSSFSAPAVSIYMANTDRVPIMANKANWVSLDSLTLVYSGSGAQPTVTGWHNIHLDNAFAYDGSNLAIVVVRNGASASTNQRYVATAEGGAGLIMRNTTDHPGTAGGTSVNYYANMKVTVTPAPGCYFPTGVVTEASSRTSARLAWQAPSIGSPTAYVVEYNALGSADVSRVVVDGTTATMTGLEPSTRYEARVRSICGAGDTSAVFSSSTAIFASDCGPRSIPYHEDFSTYEGYSSYALTNVLPYCWDFPGLSATATGYPRAFVTTTHGLRVQTRGGAGPAIAVFPRIGGNYDTLTLSFDLEVSPFTDVSYGYVDTAFQYLGSLTATRRYTLNLSELFRKVPYGSRLALKAETSSTSARGFVVSNIAIERSPGCRQPMGLAVEQSSVTANSVRLVWGGEPDPAALYRVRYVRQGTTDTTTAAVDVVDQVFDVSGLGTGYAYTFVVDRHCGDSYSAPATASVNLHGASDVVAESDERGFVVGESSGPVSTTPVYRAVARPHYMFRQWADGNTTNPRYFPYQNESALATNEAQFVPDTHMVTLAVNNAARGSINMASGRQVCGSTLSLVATPAVGSKFVGWSDGTATAAYDYTVRRDATLTAYFCAEDEVMVLGTINDPTLGTVTTIPADGMVTVGQTVTFTATLNDAEHYDFAWVPEPDEADGSGATHTASVVATESRIYAAVVTPKSYEVAMTPSDAAIGRVYGAGTYEYGTEVTLVANAAYRAEFVNWSGSVNNDTNPLSLVVDEDKALTAVFCRDSVTIVVEPFAVEHGSASLRSPASGMTSARVAVGDTIRLYAASNEHYTFSKWGNTVSNNPQTLTAWGNKNATVTQVAYFNPDDIEINAVANDNRAGEVDGSATYGYGTLAFLEAIPNEHYTFVGWSDGPVDNPRRPVVYTPRTYTAIFKAEPLTITATVDDATHGTATVRGDLCYNGVVVLTADTLPGWSFVNWTDANGTVVSTLRNYTFTATANGAYTANFVQTTYHVTVTATAGKGTIVGGNIDATYHYGDVLNIATSNVDASLYDFIGWNIGGSDNPLVHTVTASVDIVAVYREKGMFSVIVSSNNNAWGTAEADKDVYSLNEVAFVTATPAEHYRFVRWSDIDSDRNGRQIVMTRDITLTAIFEPIQYHVTLAANDSTKGAVWCTPDHTYNTEVTVTALPNRGQYLSSWTNLPGNATSTTFLIDSDTTITANFATSDVTINVQGFHASTTGSGTYPYGTQVEISATPDAHYTFLKWSDEVVSTPRYITVGDVENYVAHCTPNVYTVTGIPNNPALGYVIGSESRPYGSSNSRLEAHANPNARFVRWDDGVTTASRIVTFDADQVYTAIFALDSFEVSLAAADANYGTVNTAVNGTYEYDAEIEVVATANDGVRFTSWSDGDHNNPRIIVVREDIVGLTALFDSIDYRLDTVTNDPVKGHIVLTPAKDFYRYNETVTVSYVNHDTDLYRFVAWEDGSTDADRTLTITADRNVVAIFDEADKFSVSVISNDPALGQALGSVYSVANGTTHTVRARASEHCHFIAWSDGITDTVRDVTLAGSDFVAMAIFAKDSLSLTVNVSHPERGYVSGIVNGTPVEFPYGQQVTLQAVGSAHCTFDSWNDGITNPVRTVTLTENTVLTAEFVVDSFTVTVASVASQGSVNSDVVNARRYAYGEIVSLEATPAAGYKFASWTPGSGTSNPMVVQVTADQSYSATFSPMRLVLSVQANDPVMGSVSCVPARSYYNYNQSVTVNATVADADRYRFISWSDGNTDASRTVTLTDDLSLMAIFAEADMYSVAAFSADASMGSVTASAASVYANQTVDIVATPAANHSFVGWSDGVTASSRTITVISDTVLMALFVIDSVDVTLATDGHGTVTGAGIYAYGTQLTIFATPALGYGFGSWNDGNTDNPRTLTLYSDLSLTANFLAEKVSVSADAVNGSVTGAGDYNYGTTVTLTAVPNPHHTFLGWTRNGSPYAGAATITFSATEAVHFLASFRIDSVEVSLASAGNGSVYGSGKYAYGSSTTIFAVADDAYHFVSWNDGNTDNPRTLSLTADHNLTATFEADIVTYNIVALAIGGTVTGAGSYVEGTTVTLTATPLDDSYSFVGWTRNGVDYPGSTTISFSALEDASFVATFAIDIASLTLDIIGNGTVSGAGSYPYGSVVTFYATPDLGNRFVSWSDGITDNPRTITLISDQTLVATFAHNVFEIAAYAVNGTVTGAGPYVYGSTVTLEATPDAHHHFVGWTRNGVDYAGSTTISFPATEPAIFIVTFAIDSVELTLAPNGNGSVVGAGTYAYGATANIIAIPEEGSYFQEWSDGNTDNPRDLTLDGDLMLYANFLPNNVSITALAIGGSVEGAGVYSYGDLVTLTALPLDETYQFLGWTHNGVHYSTDEVITFIAEQNTHFVAHFQQVLPPEPPVFSVTVISGNSSWGSVSATATIADSGDYVTIAAMPNDHYDFLSWSDGSTDLVRTITVTADTVLVALFQPTHYVVTLQGDDATLTGAGYYRYGDVATVCASTPDHFHFSHWADSEGNIVSSDSCYTFDVTANVTLTAVVTADLYTITVGSNPSYGGRVLVNVNGVTTNQGRYGDLVTVTAQANEGWAFEGWNLSWSHHPVVYTFFFILHEDVTIYANFIGLLDIDPADLDEVVLYTANSTLHVLGAQGQSLRIFDAVGRQLTSAEVTLPDYQVELPASGVYLVQVGNSTPRRIAVVR